MKHEKNKPIDPKLKKKLMKEFKSEVEKTGKMINRDLIKIWGYDKI